MADFSTEKQIADELNEEMDELFSQLFDGDGSVRLPIRAKYVSRLQIYERHVAHMRSIFGSEPSMDYLESLIHYHRGRLALFSVDPLGDALLKTAEQGSDPSQALFTLFLARSQIESNTRQSARAAIPHYNQAIALFDGDFYRLQRARRYHEIGDMVNALADVDYVLGIPTSHFLTDARKLKYEIEQSQTQKKDNCFIATAVYGSSDAHEVQLLREFRDEVLVQSQLGRWFVASYYRYSPKLAVWIGHSTWARRTLKALLLAPIVSLVHRP